MKTHPPILRNSAIGLFVLVAASVLQNGGVFGAQVLGSGVLVLGNLWALSKISQRLVHSLVKGQESLMWVGILIGKIVLTLTVFGFLIFAFEPIAVFLGLSCLFVGGLIQMFLMVWKGVDVPPATEGAGTP